MTLKLRTLALTVVLNIITALTIQAQEAGFLDTSFGTNGITVFNASDTYSNAEAVAIQTDGKIVVAGYYSSNGSGCMIARYNTDGSLDTTFGVDGVVKQQLNSTIIKSMVLQDDGKILVAGTVITNNEGYPKIFIVRRFNTDGTPDTEFASGGMPLIGGTCTTMTLQADGKILLAGNNNGNGYGMVVGRLLTDGTIDTDFNPTNSGVASYGVGPISNTASSVANCSKVLSQSDGKIILAGYYTYALTGNNKRIAVVRANADGTLDNSFAETGVIYGELGVSFVAGKDDFIQTAALQTDGKILLAGYTQELNGSSKLLMIRINADGTADGSFGPFGLVTYDAGLVIAKANTIIIQPDGKIILAGSSVNNGNAMTLVRFLSNGDVDTAFGTNGVTITNLSGDDRIKASALQADGKIVVAGVTTESTTPKIMVARYNGGGTAGIEDIIADDAITVYPNPVKDVLNIKNPQNNKTPFSIINIMGQKVSEGTLTDETTSINMSGIASGIYLIKIQDREAVRIIKN